VLMVQSFDLGTFPAEFANVMIRLALQGPSWM
jgi:hypothetical protein